MICSLRTLAVILLCVAFINAQSVVEKSSDENAEKLRKDAIGFLRETLSDVNGMRSLENRISFTAELAGLMWFHDEREARSMYGGVITDFKDLLSKYNAQMNELGVTPADRQRGGFMSFGIEPTDKSQIARRFTTAVGVRQQIALTMAEHDPELAFSFFSDSLSAISNPEFRKDIERQDSYFEAQLLNQIAENSPAKAAKYGIPSLKKGVTYQHVELLRKIYSKDTEKGTEFGSAMLSRLKMDKIDPGNLYVVEHLISYGEETLEASKKPAGKPAVYTFAELRDLAEMLAQALLSRTDDDDSVGLGYIETVQRYSPGRAAQLRAKFKVANRGSRSSNMNANAYVMRAEANSVDIGEANSELSNSTAEREEREKLEKRTIEDVQKLATKELPKEEREKIVAQARKIILSTPGRDKKITLLSMLATQVSKAGDKALATEIMRDAESMVNPSPKNYQDFMLSWMLASGYATSDPDKAFPLLEDTIGRANETLAAFIKVGEFIDVAEEVIQDGEVQVGAFGGQMMRGLTNDLGLADSTIQVLAVADFGKTKSLTNRFDRAEIRILAKMMVLRAVLDPKKGAKPGSPMDVDVEN